MKQNKRNLRGATVGPSNGPSSTYRKWPIQAEKNPKFNATMLTKELKSFISKQQKNGMESSNPVIRAMYDPDSVDRALKYRLVCYCRDYIHISSCTPHHSFICILLC